MNSYSEIIASKPLIWSDIEAITVKENQDKLIELKSSDKLKLLPVYFNDGLEGAIPKLVLRKEVANRLCSAAANLPLNLGLVVFDGWRPKKVQYALRDEVRKKILIKHPNADSDWLEMRLDEFVANPKRKGMCPPHLTGGSVDVGLFDTTTDTLIDMGSVFDEASHLSYTSALETETDKRFNQAKLHRRILVSVMLAQGFTNIPTEWWHFDYGNSNWAYFSEQPFAYYGAADFEVAS